MSEDGSEVRPVRCAPYIYSVFEPPIIQYYLAERPSGYTCSLANLRSELIDID